MTMFLEDGPVKVKARAVYCTLDTFAVAFHALEPDAQGRLDEIVSRAISYRR
jgi:hypothetical protein